MPFGVGPAPGTAALPQTPSRRAVAFDEAVREAARAERARAEEEADRLEALKGRIVEREAKAKADLPHLTTGMLEASDEADRVRKEIRLTVHGRPGTGSYQRVPQPGDEHGTALGLTTEVFEVIGGGAARELEKVAQDMVRGGLDPRSPSIVYERAGYELAKNAHDPASIPAHLGMGSHPWARQPGESADEQQERVQVAVVTRYVKCCTARLAYREATAAAVESNDWTAWRDHVRLYGRGCNGEVLAAWPKWVDDLYKEVVAECVASGQWEARDAFVQENVPKSRLWCRLHQAAALTAAVEADKAAEAVAQAVAV